MNGRTIDAVIDTGSAISVIHRQTLRGLINQSKIRHEANVYLTANNDELRTIGSIDLRVKIKRVSTFISVQVANELCAQLILGNDWIQANRIDIITTSQCIRKFHKGQIVTLPFNSRAVENGKIPSVNTVIKPTKEQCEPTFTTDLTCQFCAEEFPTKKILFAHLQRTNHYCQRNENGAVDTFPQTVFDEIERLVSHIANKRDRQRTQSMLIKYGRIFDSSKPTKIRSRVKHTIEVNNSRPIAQRPYRKTAEQEKVIERMCNEFYRDGIIRPSQSPWSSPLVLQKKKDNT